MPLFRISTSKWALHLSKQMLKEIDYIRKDDLRDKFFCDPCHQKHQNYICFQQKGQLHYFICLCFVTNYSNLCQTIEDIHRKIEEGEGYFCNFSLPLPIASQTLRTQPCNYCRELTLCTQLAARLEPGTFGFQAQVANH